MIRVALCDDHPIMRGGLRQLLESEPDIDLIGEARDAANAVALARVLRPDVFIVDIGLPGASGIEATRRVLEASPKTKILILTMHVEVEYVRAAFSAGALGYLIKEAAENELLQAVRTVAQAKRYLYATLGAALLNPGLSDSAQSGAASQMSDRECSVLRLVAQGYTNAETAARLNLSVRTVETHRARVQRKLGVKSRAALTRAAHDAGLLEE